MKSFCYLLTSQNTLGSGTKAAPYPCVWDAGRFLDLPKGLFIRGDLLLLFLASESCFLLGSQLILLDGATLRLSTVTNHRPVNSQETRSLSTVTNHRHVDSQVRPEACQESREIRNLWLAKRDQTCRKDERFTLNYRTTSKGCQIC